MQRTAPNEFAPPRRSRPLLELFSRYAQRYLQRHFNAVRLLKSGHPQPVPGIPLVIYLNHASWWDPLVCLLLARSFFRERPSSAPIAADALRRYRFFERIGFFGVEESAAGAAAFLQRTDLILASPRAALWMTPQGSFADVRTRPVRFRRGLSHIASRVERAAFMPLAIEYVFWEERLPEILVSFGQPVVVSTNHRLSIDETTQLFETALTTVQDHLAAAAQRRDAREWTALLRGRAGVRGVYQIWNRARAHLRGETYRLAHSGL